MPYFSVEFPLKTELFQEHILAKRFEIGRKIFNALLGLAKNRMIEYQKTTAYKELIAKYKELSEKNPKNDTEKKEIQKALKEINKQLKELRKPYRLEKSDIEKDVKQMQKRFSQNIDSHTAQKIALFVYRSISSVLYKNGKKVHFKKYGQMTSLESKSNNSGIRFKDDFIYWFGLKIPVVIDKSNPYEVMAFDSRIVYCRLIKRYVRNKYKYYVQIVFEGYPPAKLNPDGLFKHPIVEGDVGIDIGTSTVAIVSEKEVLLTELADKAETIEVERRRLLRKLDRSRRATNPDNFNANGTVKIGKKLIWHRSKHYMKTLMQLKEIYRKQAAIRKYQHELLANYILSLGNHIYVETMNFKGLAKRTKETKKDKNGKYQSKKRFGKSIANRAPAMLLSIINRKLGYQGKELIEIDTWKAKASQFNHFDESYTKKKLSQRWNYINGYKIQRDLYSAFLIMNINEDLKSFDLNKCKERFEHFYELHNQEILKLKQDKHLASMGV